MKKKKEYKLIIFFILIYLFLNTISFSIKLSSVEGLRKLSNYSEIKDIEVEKIVSSEEIERKKGLVHEKNMNTLFNGALIARNNKKEILGIYIYIYGKYENHSYDYYENGQLKIIVKQKNDKSNGSLFFNVLDLSKSFSKNFVILGHIKHTSKKATSFPANKGR